jgi:hypothetical protein
MKATQNVRFRTTITNSSPRGTGDAAIQCICTGMRSLRENPTRSGARPSIPTISKLTRCACEPFSASIRSNLLHSAGLREFLPQAGVDADWAECIVTAFESPGSGGVTFTQFLDFITAAASGGIATALFKVLDTNNDGILNTTVRLN